MDGFSDTGSIPVISTKQRKPLIKPIGGFFLILCGFSGFHNRKFNSDFDIKISRF